MKYPNNLINFFIQKLSGISGFNVKILTKNFGSLFLRFLSAFIVLSSEFPKFVALSNLLGLSKISINDGQRGPLLNKWHGGCIFWQLLFLSGYKKDACSDDYRLRTMCSSSPPLRIEARCACTAHYVLTRDNGCVGVDILLF